MINPLKFKNQDVEKVYYNGILLSNIIYQTNCNIFLLDGEIGGSCNSGDNSEEIIEEIFKSVIIKAYTYDSFINKDFLFFKDNSYVDDYSEVTATFYIDEYHGVGWNKDSSTARVMWIDVRDVEADTMTIVYSHFLRDNGIGHFVISGYKDDKVTTSSDVDMLLIQDGWANNSEGHSLYVNGDNIYYKTTNEIIDRKDILQIPDETAYIKIEMNGDSSYSYDYTYIKELILGGDGTISMNKVFFEKDGFIFDNEEYSVNKALISGYSYDNEEYSVNKALITSYTYDNEEYSVNKALINGYIFDNEEYSVNKALITSYTYDNEL